MNGNQFVAASVVVINGTTLATTFVSSQELQVTITTALITGPGTANVAVNTPSGNSGDLGCNSGGTSSPRLDYHLRQRHREYGARMVELTLKQKTARRLPNFYAKE